MKPSKALSIPLFAFALYTAVSAYNHDQATTKYIDQYKVSRYMENLEETDRYQAKIDQGKAEYIELMKVNPDLNSYELQAKKQEVLTSAMKKDMYDSTLYMRNVNIDMEANAERQRLNDEAAFPVSLYIKVKEVFAAMYILSSFSLSK